MSKGHWILIDHGAGIETGYEHNDQLTVAAGDTVAAGQVIATVGQTGNTTACHLHFEVLVHGTAVDPEPFLPPGAR